ncbi:MAG: dihydrolipoamide acetyltransferase family protein [Deltaproteobacteria bacterium]|nr:dihydrolipoamide acetyltransferase family protein [Deltaproteobacteria bacterium]
MATKILLTMPQPGETITEGHVVRWIAKPGGAVKEGQPVVELETEKAVFEYESPYEGKLLEILSPDGSSVPVGNPIAVFEVSDEKASTYFMLGIGSKAGKIPPSPPFSKGGDLHPSPLIRRLMHEFGIDLSELGNIHGTGPGGRITKENIVAYLQSKTKPASQSGDETIPLSPVRLRTAENMAKASATIPHAHASVSVDLSSLLKKKGEKSIFSLIFPALKEAILKQAIVNSSFRDKSIVIHKKLNLGVAVDAGAGLYIVVVPNAHEKSAQQVENEVAALVAKARNEKLTPVDLTGMTFTFNNYGYYGTTMGVQIILPPQSTTLGMGVITKRPWVVGDKIEIRQVADFTLAFDHRVLDGREAGQFLTFLKKLLEVN